MNSMELASTLAGKIAKASIDAGAFRADKRNAEKNYAYISADQVLSRAGDALASNGVILIPSLIDVQIENIEKQGKDRPISRIDARVQLSIEITDGEKSIVVPWYGFGTDYASPDKAVYKAITSGHKYFLMKLLNIGVGNEDGEHESARAQAIAEAIASGEIEGEAPMSIEEARAMPVARGSKQTIGQLAKPALEALINGTKSDDLRLAATLVMQIDYNMTNGKDQAAA